MYQHQGRHFYWRQLCKFAAYEPPAGAASGSPEWHRGQWVARPAATGGAADAAGADVVVTP
jgi:hypothetical protein